MHHRNISRGETWFPAPINFLMLPGLWLLGTYLLRGLVYIQYTVLPASLLHRLQPGLWLVQRMQKAANGHSQSDFNLSNWFTALSQTCHANKRLSINSSGPLPILQLRNPNDNAILQPRCKCERHIHDSLSGCEILVKVLGLIPARRFDFCATVLDRAFIGNLFSRLKKYLCFKKLFALWNLLFVSKFVHKTQKILRAFKYFSGFKICSPFRNLFSRFIFFTNSKKSKFSKNCSQIPKRPCFS